MNRINKSAFFEKVGPLNITPRVDVATLPQRHYVSHWELPNRTTMGKSVTDSWGVEPTGFWLSTPA